MKNLANFKVAVKTREYLIQAIFQMLFSDQKASQIINQFKNEHKNKKVDFILFANSLNSIQNNRRKIESILISLKIKDSNIEIIDKSIMYFAINEMITGDLDKLVVIDESLRLSKKFSSPESYKFINASLDKYLKTHK
ncbi:MAG: transcription antitermination protein NusB [Pseudomonadota bacterium]|jgi:N utilization substance protein B|nr:transcription antitermination protein NusB [Pseudomonadota bacterium]|tara:strand:+ start:19 stop:432 length:414 start_codon:yes stop_codon:yes gene_type:complete